MSDAESPEDQEEFALTDMLISPEFTVPEGIRVDPKIPEMLREVFADLTSASEEISKDYHEENAFKRYLQSRWTQLIDSLSESTSSTS
jgi:hypothetical protein